jgi:DNA-binding MarR family transcriptional regulator
MRKINTRNFRVATRSTPREVNRQIVLNLIREHQPISRAELARRMKVARSALTPIVRDLVGAGSVYESGAAAPTRTPGRRPTMLRMRTRGRLAIAADVRPGLTAVALADFAGRDPGARHVRDAGGARRRWWTRWWRASRGCARRSPRRRSARTTAPGDARRRAGGSGS